MRVEQAGDKTGWFVHVDESDYCTCDSPDVDLIDQCGRCLRAHKPTVYARYGWPLEVA